MDDSLKTLVDETQIDSEENNYIINFDLEDDIRYKYCGLSWIIGLILNIILIINFNNSNFVNIILSILNNIFLFLPLILTYKNKYNKLVKDNLVLVLLLCISVLFEFIFCINDDKNKLTLILILIIKNIILIYYLLKTNNLLYYNIY